jgi:hypothetical protein
MLQQHKQIPSNVTRKFISCFQSSSIDEGKTIIITLYSFLLMFLKIVAFQSKQLAFNDRIKINENNRNSLLVVAKLRHFRSPRLRLIIICCMRFGDSVSQLPEIIGDDENSASPSSMFIRNKSPSRV